MDQIRKNQMANAASEGAAISEMTNYISKAFKETLQKVINDDSKSIQNNEHMKMLIRVLYNLRDMEELLNFVLKMSTLFPESSYPLEWICKVYMETHV